MEKLSRKRLISRIFGAAFALALAASMPAHAAGKTELTWYGHSAFKLTTPSGKVLLLDPWIANPANPNGKKDLDALNRADLILVSHGHFDHVGDSVAIAKKTGAQLVSTFDLGRAMVAYAGYPEKQASFATQGNFGGTLDLLGGEVKVTFVPAVHSSGIVDAKNDQHFAGNPGGFLITVKGGPTIYFTGDTDEFVDMAHIRRIHKVDVMIACIGDHFTMGPEQAAEAAALVKPKVIVPMHFATFKGVLTGTPEAFGKALKAHHVPAKLEVMKVDETINL